jgi:hypothetical protein
MTLAENSSPGVHFIDVVLKMMNSGIDLTKLGHMMLKAWLEIILIIVYKVYIRLCVHVLRVINIFYSTTSWIEITNKISLAA